MSQIPIYLMESFKFGISRFDGGGGGRGEGKFTKISLGGEGRDIFWKNVIIIKVRCIVYLYSIFY